MAVDPCTEYGLALALEDFVPVVLAGAGAIVLATAAGRRVPELRVPALVGGLLITAGGVGKATWKVLVASEPCRNVELLEQLLFPCLAFGFALLAWAVVGARRGSTAPWLPFAAVPVLGSFAGLAVGAIWPLLVVAAVGAITMAVVAARWAWDLGDRRTTALFALYVVGTLVLPPLAARPEQSQTLQWVEQLTNTAVQLCFLLGALALRGRATPSTTPSHPESAGALS